MEELEDFLFKPGRQLETDTDEFQTLNKIIKMILGKTHDIIIQICQQKKFDIQRNDIRISMQESFPGSQVISLCIKKSGRKTTLKYLIENKNDFLICLKSDGMRYLLALTNEGKAFFISRKMEFFEVNLNINKLTYVESSQNLKIVYLFDGELIVNPNSKNQNDFHFQFFDCILFKNALIVDANYMKRLEFCEQFIIENQFINNFKSKSIKNGKQLSTTMIKVFLKDFYEVQEIEFLLKNIAELKMYKNNIDGVIFTRDGFPYLPGKSCGILKWKPPSLNSIDFLVVENKNFIQINPELFQRDDFFVFELYAIHQGQFALFDYFFVFDTNVYIDIKKDMKTMSVFNVEIEAIIAEFKYDKTVQNQKIKEFYNMYFDYDIEKIQQLQQHATLSQYISSDPQVLNQFFMAIEKRYDIVNDTFKGNWQKMRIRADKKLPNGYITARNVFVGLFEELITQDMLIDNLMDLKLLQNYYNSMIRLSEYLVERYHKLLGKFIKQRDLTTLECRFLGYPVNKIEMESEQVFKILNIDKNQFDLNLVQKRAVTIYDLNDPDDNGSPYIQSKVINAYKTALVILGETGGENSEFHAVREKVLQEKKNNNDETNIKDKEKKQDKDQEIKQGKGVEFEQSQQNNLN